MGNFNRGGSRGGGGFGGGRGGSSFGGRGGRPSFGGGQGGFKDMHKAVCSECSQSCEVPFRPTNGKPVYCKDCFATKGDERDSRGGDRGGDRGGRFPQREFNNDRVQVKPAFVNTNGGNADVLKKIDELNVKIDRLAKAVEALSSTKAVQEKVAVKEVEIAVKNSDKKAPKKKVAVKKTK
ncbi:MAG: CxxC-x17-CxxC domain-containing protein [Candidatus Paceibacterota bacterium]